MELQTSLRGLYRLLAHLRNNPARAYHIRALQRRLVALLPAFLATEGSPAHTAERAEILDALAYASLDLGGQPFDAFCQRIEGAIPLDFSPDPGTPFIIDAYIAWLDGLVGSGRIIEPDAVASVENATLDLLPKLAPAHRGQAVQALYDAGLLFDLDARISLDGAHLSRADLVDAMLAWADLRGANLRGASMVGGDFGHARLCRANLITARLGWAEMAAADLTEAEMAGVVLMSANLTGAAMSRANLVKGMLKNARLGQAKLAGANLLGAHLAGADLTGADLTGAILLWADLSGATVDGIRLEDAVYNVHTRWPLGFATAGTSMRRVD